ncbi:hypothetical protein NPIL_551431 [Nephila pilipes]|uniref:Uncharacterized protein n=1 Tax=Nephila pilipes TaxID=299642 RepID=A0A8X6UN61_NEPPI|nr:hypothetical protein NPIL_551431 [Nephila pilipes]
MCREFQESELNHSQIYLDITRLIEREQQCSCIPNAQFHETSSNEESKGDAVTMEMAFRRLKLGLMRCCIMMILFVMATSTAQNDNQDSILTNAARELNGHREKRDLAHLKELEHLLISVEEELENYGITEKIEATCQLKATCEIYKRNVNTQRRDESQIYFIKLEKFAFY